ncbi:MAG: hypothetical protein RLZ86_1026 [Actinomycetota bacterium]
MESSESRPSPWLGAPLFVFGVLSVWVGSDLLERQGGLLRIGVVSVGLGAIYVGLDRMLWRLRGHRVAVDYWLSVSWLAVIGLAAIFADLLPFAESRDASKSFSAPVAARPDLFSSHPLGTDTFGLDLLGGVVYGARLSLQISFGAVIIGLVLGGMLGMLAGYFRGVTDEVLGVLTNSLLAIPPLIFLIALMVAIEPSVLNLSIALAFLGIPTYVRLARANTLVFRQKEFVVAAKSTGARHGRVLVREILPNVLLPLVSYAFIVVAVLIVAEGSLSFLGLSIPRPEPTWGNMISAGANDLRRTPHLVFVPGTVMFITVFALNRVGDHARQKWDPRESRV